MIGHFVAFVWVRQAYLNNMKTLPAFCLILMHLLSALEV